MKKHKPHVLEHRNFINGLRDTLGIGPLYNRDDEVRKSDAERFFTWDSWIRR